MIVGLIEWWIQYDFQCYSIGFYSILLYSIVVSLPCFIHFTSILFYVYSDLFLFNKSKSISWFNINHCIVLYCIVLSTDLTMDSQMWIIIQYQSIPTIPLCHFMIMIMIMIIRSKQFPINIEQILVQTYSNHHLYIIIIGRLDSSFVNVQYVIIGSLVIIIMMIENNDWLIETTIIIQYHC